MVYRRRIYYSSAQRADIWDRWQRGESMSSIGRLFDRESSSIFSVLSPTGGIRPADRTRSKQALSLAEREEVSRGLSVKQSLRSIARQLGRSPSTISREVGRNGGTANYRATVSDQAAWDRALRPKLCKLACTPALSYAVSAKLQRKWSPEQIAGWLKCAFPGEPRKQARHQRKHQPPAQTISAAWNRSVGSLTSKTQRHRSAAQRAPTKDLAISNPSGDVPSLCCSDPLNLPLNPRNSN